MLLLRIDLKNNRMTINIYILQNIDIGRKFKDSLSIIVSDPGY